jgi:hypothetical protein
MREHGSCCEGGCVAGHDDFDLIVPPALIAGAWANTTRARPSPDDVTIDFIRLDPFENRGVVVARVALTPWAIGELADSLLGVWQTWMRNSMPPEAQGDDG